MSHHDLLVVILAGGQGKRFAPLVTNKTIFPFMDKPLILHQLEQLQRVGVKHVLLATNKDNDEYLRTLTLEGLAIKTKRQHQPLGMADALLNLSSEIGQRPILVTNAVDVVADSLFQTLLQKTTSETIDGLVTGIKVKQYFPGGYLQLQQDRAVGVIEKPQPGQEPSDLVNLVFHYFRQPQKFLSLLKEKAEISPAVKTDDIYEQALTALLKQQNFGVVDYDGYWHKLKYPHYVLDVMELFLNHRLQPQVDPSAQVSTQAIIEGPVVIAPQARIEAGAVIKGPAYIGPHTIIGNHTLIRQSIIEREVVIGFGSEVARSYIGPGCALHHNFIGDSVLEAKVNPSFGTVTTNWRLDKKRVTLKTVDNKILTQRDKLGSIFAQGVFCGVNCSFMPGVTIGANAKIYPHSVIYQAISANSTHRSSQD